MKANIFAAGVVLTLALSHSPLAAEPAYDMGILRAMVNDLDHHDPYMRLNGAVAACLAGEGDQYLTTSWFEDHGWKPRVDVDMGIVEMRKPGADNMFAWVAEDGGSYRVWSEEIGTAAVKILLKDLMLAARIRAEKSTGENGCSGLTLVAGNVGYAVEITSSGNDPVCDAADNSAVHVIRAEG